MPCPPSDGIFYRIPPLTPLHMILCFFQTFSIHNKSVFQSSLHFGTGSGSVTRNDNEHVQITEHTMQVLQHPDFFPARSGMLPLQVLHIIFQDVHLHLPPAHRQISLDLFCHSFHNNSDFLQKTRLNYKNAHPHTPSCRHAPRYAHSQSPSNADIFPSPHHKICDSAPRNSVRNSHFQSQDKSTQTALCVPSVFLSFPICSPAIQAHIPKHSLYLPVSRPVLFL